MEENSNGFFTSGKNFQEVCLGNKFAQNEEPCTYYLSYPLHLWKKILWGSLLVARTCKKSVLGMRTHAMWDPSAGAKFPELYPGIEISCPMFQMNW